MDQLTDSKHPRRCASVLSSTTGVEISIDMGHHTTDLQSILGGAFLFRQEGGWGERWDKQSLEHSWRWTLSNK